ncbi:MAG: heavy metal translocating P-type ATPase [Verrucomicrobia bacterium]|nr:heavy metal translocating P-type ATPase [Verrucomicrobiota bacterium]
MITVNNELAEPLVRQKSAKLKIRSSSDGFICVKSPVFKRPKSLRCQLFVQRLFSLDGITSADITPHRSACRISYDALAMDTTSICAEIQKGLDTSPSDPTHPPPIRGIHSDPTTKSITLRRLGKIISCWKIMHQLPGRIRFRHPLLLHNFPCCQHIEKALFNTVGVNKYKANPTTGTVLILFDEEKVPLDQLVRVLENSISLLKRNGRNMVMPQLVFAANTTSLLLSILSTSFFTVLLPLNAALVFYTAIPSLKGALRCIFKEKRVGVDILDSVVTMSCLLTGEVFAAALMVWCLSIGKTIMDKTAGHSQRLLTDAFGKQPVFAWLRKNGQETQVPVNSLQRGDIIVVNTGETIPVDGEVVYGEAMVDQHALTGESAPVEKTPGDPCSGSTVLMAGLLHIRVNETGENTVAAKIIKIITQSVNYKVRVQSIGEKIADKAVIPTLGLAILGYFTAGHSSAMAIINSDFGTGIRVAAPTALLASLIVAAKKGVLVKKGSALEYLSQVKTFIFDKTGTLTQEVPEVREIICSNGKFSPRDVLFYAAIAEQKFTHPIARAILKKAEKDNIRLETKDNTKYNIGFGVEVKYNGNIIKVGSHKYMAKENINIPTSIHKEIKQIHRKGGSAVMVAVDDYFAGVIELESSHRAEAYDVIQGLRFRGVEDIVLISGDHEAPTKALAGKLGIDQYYSEILPADKQQYVKKFQSKGHSVAMVGDGINDAPALSTADVSISLRGASDIAVDVADVVLMDGDLRKITSLYDVSDNLRRNVRRSMAFIAIPNSFCILGALGGFFGLTASLIMNNGANFLATLNGTLPLGMALNDEEEDICGKKS